MYRMYKEDDGCWECQQNKFKKGGAKGSDKKWIQKAVKGMRKDKPCTGSKFGGPSCPPGTKRYNLAKVFREMAAKKKKEMGGQSAPMNMAENIGQNNINYFTNALKNNATQAMQQNMLNQVAQQEIMPSMYLGGQENIFGYNPDKVNEYDNYLNAAKNQKRFNIGNFIGSVANRMDADAAYANWWNETQMQPIEKLTTKLNRKQIREDIKRGGLQEEIARDYRKEFNKAAAKNRWAGFKIGLDKLNPFTPNPEIPQTQYFTNTQTQQNQYGGTINYNDMNYFNNMPYYNMGGAYKYFQKGGGVYNPEMTDAEYNALTDAEKIMYDREIAQYINYTEDQYNALPAAEKSRADLIRNWYNNLSGEYKTRLIPQTPSPTPAADSSATTVATPPVDSSASAPVVTPDSIPVATPDSIPVTTADTTPVTTPVIDSQSVNQPIYGYQWSYNQGYSPSTSQHTSTSSFTVSPNQLPNEYTFPSSPVIKDKDNNTFEDLFGGWSYEGLNEKIIDKLDAAGKKNVTTRSGPFAEFTGVGEFPDVNIARIREIVDQAKMAAMRGDIATLQNLRNWFKTTQFPQALGIIPGSNQDLMQNIAADIAKWEQKAKLLKVNNYDFNSNIADQGYTIDNAGRHVKTAQPAASATSQPAAPAPKQYNPNNKYHPFISDQDYENMTQAQRDAADSEFLELNNIDDESGTPLSEDAKNAKDWMSKNASTYNEVRQALVQPPAGTQTAPQTSGRTSGRTQGSASRPRAKAVPTTEVENTSNLVTNNQTNTANTQGDPNAGASSAVTNNNIGTGTGTSSGTGFYQETPIYYPSQQIGYMGVPVMGGNNLMPGYTLKNKYVPGGYGLMPIAYNAAQTFLDKNEVKDYKKGLIPSIFGSRRITTTTFKHNVLTPEQQNQLFQIEMRRRGYNVDGTPTTGGDGSSGNPEKAAFEAMNVVNAVSNSEAQKAAEERAAQGLPPDAQDPNASANQSVDSPPLATDESMIKDQQIEGIAPGEDLSYKFYGSEDPLDPKYLPSPDEIDAYDKMNPAERIMYAEKQFDPSLIEPYSGDIEPEEEYTVDELVQEQNNPNTTGNNRNVITGRSNANKSSVGMQKTDPTGMGMPPADYQPVPTAETPPTVTETPITESELDIDYTKIPVEDGTYSTTPIKTLTPEPLVINEEKPAMTSAEEEARIEEQINMAENKGNFYGGGTVRRKSYMNGGNVQLQALHNEMQALTARQNEIRNLINNQMFNSGQLQLPTEMQQPMPMQQPMQQPVARYGYQVKNGNLMNSMAMGGAYDYYGSGGSYMDYNEGGEYYLSDDEIQAFLAAGGQLEIME